ncbi:MAG: hypothetical protein AB1428_10770 [Bacteroidota bacterium]
MLISIRQRLFLWAPSLMFVALVLGRFDKAGGSLVYRVMENGFVCSVFLLMAAGFISSADPKSFRAGVVMWILAVIALFALRQTVVFSVYL